MPRRPYPRSDRRGASKVEYGLLAGLLAVGAITAVDGVGGSVANLLDDSAGAVENAVAGIGGDGGNDGGNDGGGAGNAPDVAEIVGVSADGGPAFFAGDQITIHVDYDEPVDVTGAPTFRLDLDSGPVDAVYAGGDGTDRISFSYTLQAGDVDADGIAYPGQIDPAGGGLAAADDGASADLLTAAGVFGGTSVVAVLTPTASLFAPDTSGNFGASIDMDGTEVLIGSPGELTNDGWTGNYYLYAVGSGQFAYRMNFADMDSVNDLQSNWSSPAHGGSVAFSNGQAIGGWFKSEEDSEDLYDDIQHVRRLDVQALEVGARLSNPDIPYAYNFLHANNTLGRFGSSLDTDGSHVIVTDDSARIDENDQATDNALHGRGYVFDLSTNAVVAKLHAIDQEDHDEFGRRNSSAIDGDAAVIGAYNHASNRGEAFLFDLSAAKATQDATMTLATRKLSESVPGGVPASADFGFAAAAHSGRIAVAARDERAVYLFQPNGDFLRRIALPASYAGGTIRTIDLQDDQLIVGYYVSSPTSDDHRAAFVYNAPSGALTHVLAPPASNGIFPWDVTIDGGNAVVSDYVDKVVHLYQLN